MLTPMLGPPKKVPIADTSDSAVALAVVNDRQQGRGEWVGGTGNKARWQEFIHGEASLYC
jgi:hypothetical protein